MHLRKIFLKWAKQGIYMEVLVIINVSYKMVFLIFSTEIEEGLIYQ